MKAQFIAFSPSEESFPKVSFPEIAFIGRSNVGKSSLINTLLKEKIARTSSTPGRTQGLCFFKIPPHFVFVDFPGFGYARVSKDLKEQWSKLAEQYYQSDRPLKGTIWILDSRRDFDELDQQTYDWLLSLSKPFVMILNKCDQLLRKDWETKRKKMAENLDCDSSQIILFSSKTQEGVKELWRWIKQV